MKIPYVSEELVEHLERIFPDRCPSLTDSDREVWASYGRASVVRHLKALLKDQEKRALLGKSISRS